MQPSPDTWSPCARKPSIAAPVIRPIAPSRTQSPILAMLCTSHHAVPQANTAPFSSQAATIASASANRAAIGFSQEMPRTPACAQAITGVARRAHRQDVGHHVRNLPRQQLLDRVELVRNGLVLREPFASGPRRVHQRDQFCAGMVRVGMRISPAPVAAATGHRDPQFVPPHARHTSLLLGCYLGRTRHVQSGGGPTDVCSFM